jgi:hypothetical protein
MKQILIIPERPAPSSSPYVGANASLQRFEVICQMRDLIVAKISQLHQRLAIMPNWDTPERFALMTVTSYNYARGIEVSELLTEVRAEFSRALSEAKNAIPPARGGGVPSKNIEHASVSSLANAEKAA